MAAFTNTGRSWAPKQTNLTGYFRSKPTIRSGENAIDLA
jgi:hypothetical protein